MGLGEQIMRVIEMRRDRKRRAVPGPLGDFYRAGGNEQLYDMPVTTESLIVDVGGYRGDWTAGMIEKFGCRSEIYEPVPEFAQRCRERFAENRLVRVHACGFGGRSRRELFVAGDDGSSQYLEAGSRSTLEVDVVDVAGVFTGLGDEPIACLKLNIEGGEYEVVERLLEVGEIERCRSLLVQFHRQPEGWKARYEAIVQQLRRSHRQEWCFPLIWGKWSRR